MIRITVTEEDIEENPVCPVEPALERATGEKWSVGVSCAERVVKVQEPNEDGEMEEVVRVQIIEMPSIVYNFIAAAAAGEEIAPIEFEVEEPRFLN
jgi:hypothetical protein